MIRVCLVANSGGVKITAITRVGITCRTKFHYYVWGKDRYTFASVIAIVRVDIGRWVACAWRIAGSRVAL